MVLTADLQKLLYTKQTTPWNELESIMIVSGAAGMWSQQGLESFVSFLLQIYEDRGNAVEFVKRHGVEFPICKQENSLLIPCTKEEHRMWHISDMHILEALFGQNTPSRHIRNNNDKELSTVISQAGILSDVRFEKQESRIVAIHVHCQGPSKKMIPQFLSFVAGNRPHFT